ncbi:hypothetical protein D3C75_1167120 [compost metagenome]
MLGQIHRLVGRQHDTGGSQDDAACGCGEEADVDQGLKDVRHIVVIRVVERNVTHP